MIRRKNFGLIRILMILSLGLIVGLANHARAQESQPNGKETEIENFDRFLDHHPRISEKLAQNPMLVNDPAFIADHPPLEKFLANHPAFSAEVKKSPGTIGRHEGTYGWTPAALGSSEGRRFNEGYLHDHPEVALQIATKPSLLDNPQFVAAHPGLQNYINAHPDLRAEMKLHAQASAAAGQAKGVGN